MLAEMDAAVEAARSRRKIDGSSNRYIANPWLSFTEWPQHLAGFQREELLATIRPKAESVQVVVGGVDEESEDEDDEEELEQAY